MSVDWEEIESAWFQSAAEAIVATANQNPSERFYAGAFFMLYGNYSSILVPAFGASGAVSWIAGGEHRAQASHGGEATRVVSARPAYAGTFGAFLRSLLSGDPGISPPHPNVNTLGERR
jgi:hypothetical protein